MDEAEFDRYALAYEDLHRQNIKITGDDPSYFAEYKIRLFASWTQGECRNVIDFGSGIGNSIPYFRTYFSNLNLVCCDISQRSLDYASRRFPGPERMLKVSKDGIQVPDKSFDAIFSACAFHHIPYSEHAFWFKELRRVLRPGGLMAVFEHNPLNPLTRRAVSTCPFDENALLVPAKRLETLFKTAELKNVRRRYHIFFPRVARGLRVLEPALAKLPIGGQYSVVGWRSLDS